MEKQYQEIVKILEQFIESRFIENNGKNDLIVFPFGAITKLENEKYNWCLSLDLNSFYTPLDFVIILDIIQDIFSKGIKIIVSGHFYSVMDDKGKYLGEVWLEDVLKFSDNQNISLEDAINILIEQALLVKDRPEKLN